MDIYLALLSGIAVGVLVHWLADRHLKRTLELITKAVEKSVAAVTYPEAEGKVPQADTALMNALYADLTQEKEREQAEPWEQ